MNRRNFILIGSAGLAAIAVPAGYYLLSDVRYDKSLAEPRSLSLIWDNQAIVTVGEHYRLMTPREDDENSIARRLLAAASDVGGKETSDLELKIRQDFDEGNTVIVDGWILAKTEAQQCALFSLIQTK